MRDLPLRARVFLLALCLSAAPVLWLLSRRYGLPPGLIGFGILFLLADLVPVTMRDASYSVSYVIGVAALVSLGPSAAAAAAAFGGLMHLVHEPRGRRLAKTVFNSAQLTLSAAGSGLVRVGVITALPAAASFQARHRLVFAVALQHGEIDVVEALVLRGAIL